MASDALGYCLSCFFKRNTTAKQKVTQQLGDSGVDPEHRERCPFQALKISLARVDFGDMTIDLERNALAARSATPTKLLVTLQKRQILMLANRGVNRLNEVPLALDKHLFKAG